MSAIRAEIYKRDSIGKWDLFEYLLRGNFTPRFGWKSAGMFDKAENWTERPLL